MAITEAMTPSPVSSSRRASCIFSAALLYRYNRGEVGPSAPHPLTLLGPPAAQCMRWVARLDNDARMAYQKCDRP